MSFEPEEGTVWMRDFSTKQFIPSDWSWKVVDAPGGCEVSVSFALASRAMTPVD